MQPTDSGARGRGLVPLIGMMVAAWWGGSTPLAAQPTRAASERPLAWVTAGFGVSTTPAGGAALGGLDVSARPHLFSLRTVAILHLSDERLWEYAVLYGRVRRGPRSALSAAIGLGLMSGERCTGFLGSARQCAPIASRVGLPFAVRRAWHPSRSGGLGRYGFGNLNAEQSFAGLALIVEVGAVR